MVDALEREGQPEFTIQAVGGMINRKMEWQSILTPPRLEHLYESARATYGVLRVVRAEATLRQFVASQGSHHVRDAIQDLLEGKCGPSPCADEFSPGVLEKLENLYRSSPSDAAALGGRHAPYAPNYRVSSLPLPQASTLFRSCRLMLSKS